MPRNAYIIPTKIEVKAHSSIRGLKSGLYRVRLYFTVLNENSRQERSQDIRLQGTLMAEHFNTFKEVDGMMKRVTKEFTE